MSGTLRTWASTLLALFSWAKKGVEMWLRTTDQPSQILHDRAILGYADLIDRQYFFRLRETSEPPAIAKKGAKPEDIELWHSRMGHLVYKSLILAIFAFLDVEYGNIYQKKSARKLDERSYQGIHVGYEGTNQYRLYDPHSGRVTVTRDLHFDEAHRYDKKDLKPQDFSDDEWHKEDDELFADPTDIWDASEPNLELDTESRASSPPRFSGR